MAKSGTDGFKKLATGVGEAGKAAFTVGAAGAQMTGGVAKGGAQVVGKTASGTAGLLGGALNMVAKFAQKHPKVTFLVSLYAGIKLVQNYMNKRKEAAQPPVAEEGWQAPTAAAPQPQAAEQVLATQDALSPQDLDMLRQLQQQGQAMHSQQAGNAANQWEAQTADKREKAQEQGAHLG